MKYLILFFLSCFISFNSLAQDKVELKKRPSKYLKDINEWYVVNNHTKTVFVVCLKKKTNCFGEVSTLRKEIELNPGKSRSLDVDKSACMSDNIETIDYSIESVRFKEE